MANQNNNALTEYIERARKVLQHEQRTNHQDQAIRSGGLEAFVGRWIDETSNICKNAQLDPQPLYRFAEQLEAYRKQDPMQRAASLRAALAILNELDNHTRKRTAGVDATVSDSITASKSNTEKHEPPSKTAHESTTPNRQATAAKPVADKAIVDKMETSRNPIRLEAGMSQGHTTLTLLSADITAIPGVGPTVATRLHSLGIHTVRDLLFYFPREHRDYSKLEKIANIPYGEMTTTMGLIWEVETQRINNGRTRTI